MNTIYMIYCKDENVKDIYIGSTKNLTNRITTHKKICTKEQHRNYKTYLYQFIRDNGGFENFSFKILNQIEYIDDIISRKQEQCYIDCYKPTLNTTNAYINPEEVKKRERERIKKYFEEHREEIKQMQKNYNKEHKEEVAVYKKKIL